VGDSSMPTEIEHISRSGAKIIVFGPFRLMPRLRLLLEHDTPVHIGSRALDLLIALTERPSLQPARYTQAMHEQRNGTDARRMEAFSPIST
jgi:hypothetical protein